MFFIEILLIKTERNSRSWNEFETFVLVKFSEWAEIFSGGVFFGGVFFGGGGLIKNILFASVLMR